MAIILLILQAHVWLVYQGWKLVTPLMTPQSWPGQYRPLERWMSVRDAVGIGLTGAALAYWRGMKDLSVSTAYDNWTNGVQVSVLVALIAFCVSCLTLLTLHRSGSRVALLKRLLLPLMVATGYCGGVTLPLIAMNWARQQLPKPGIIHEWADIWMLLLGLAGNILLLAAALFWFGAVLHASILAARHFFRVDDANPGPDVGPVQPRLLEPDATLSHALKELEGALRTPDSEPGGYAVVLIHQQGASGSPWILASDDLPHLYNLLGR